MQLSGRARLAALLSAVLVAALVTATPPASAYTEAPEDYASYQPEDGCKAKPRPGTRRLAAWINETFGGGTAVASVRRCDKSTSEHQDGRAIDWMMDAGTKRDRREVNRFLATVLGADAESNDHALARRMGVMYLIWNDGMYSAYRSQGADHFERRAYGCGCGSATTRHRDHVHISLSLRGGRGLTSWYTEGP